MVADDRSAAVRSWIDAELRSYLDATARDLPEAAPLIEELRALVDAGGKRLRPSFCYWGYRAAGGSGGAGIRRAAASLELLHTFALVHDDVMDGSDLRRGRSTVHARRGIGVAVLAGDLALVLADSSFLDSGFPPETLARAFAAYTRMRREVIAGQFLDLELAGRPDVSEDEARRVALLKSGRYTVAEPLAIGALLADGTESLVEGLTRFGELVGEAFQLRDDILGVFGDPSITGKPADSDIREGKRNLLFAKARALASAEDRDFLDERWGGGESLTADEIKRLRGTVASSGALAETQALSRDLVEEALEMLEKVPLDGGARPALAGLARDAVLRVA